MKLKNKVLGIGKNLWLIPIGSRLAISPYFVILAFAAAFGGYAKMFFLSYASALLHESAHICTAKRLGIKISRIEILPFGICGRLGCEFIKNPYKEIAVASAGPMLSGFLALSAYMRLKYGTSDLFLTDIEYVFKINLSLMLINIIPALPLDGGRILKGILSVKFGSIRAYNIILKVSRLPIFIILFVSVLLLLTSDYNFSLILIGAFLLGNLTFEQKNIGIISLKELLYYKDKLGKTEFCSTTHLAAHCSVRASKFLKKLGFYRYHIIDVIDDNGKIIKTITESELISAMIHRSIRLKMGDI